LAESFDLPEEAADDSLEYDQRQHCVSVCFATIILIRLRSFFLDDTGTQAVSAAAPLITPFHVFDPYQ
jgi:hypothetical protein